MAINPAAASCTDASAVPVPECGASNNAEVYPVQAFVDLSKFSKEVRSKLATFEDTSSAFGQNFIRLENTLQQQSVNIQTLEIQLRDRVSDVEQSLLNSLSSKMDDINSQFQSVQSTLDVRQNIKQLETVVENVRTDIAMVVEREKSSASMMEQFRAELAHMKSQQILNQELLEQKAAIKDVHRLDSEICHVRLLAGDIGGKLDSKADLHALDQATLTLAATHTDSDRKVETMKAVVETISAQVQDLGSQIEEKAGTAILKDQLEKINARLQCTEDALGCDGLQPLRADIAQVQDRMISCERSLESKAECVSLSEVGSNLATLRAHASGIESSLLETFGDMQSQLTEMQRAISGKISTKELQPLEVQLRKLEYNVNAIDKVTHEKVERAQVHQLEEGTAAMRRQIAGIETLLVEKVGNELNSKFCDLEQSLQQKADKKQVDKDFVNVRAQICGIESVIVDEVGNEMQSKITTLEHVLNKKADESALKSVVSRMQEVESCLQSKADFKALETLQTSALNMDSRARKLEQCLQTKADSVLVDNLDKCFDNFREETCKTMQSKLDRFDHVSRTLSLKVAVDSARTKEAMDAIETKFTGADGIFKDSLETRALMWQSSLAECKAQIAQLQEHLQTKADIRAVPAKQELEEVKQMLEQRAEAQIGAVSKELQSQLASSTDHLMKLAIGPVCPPGTPVEMVPNSPAPQTTAMLKRQRTIPTVRSMLDTATSDAPAPEEQSAATLADTGAGLVTPVRGCKRRSTPVRER